MNSIFIKYVYIMILAIICSFTFQNLNAQQLLWQKVFDTGVEEYAKGVAIDSQENIVVVGTTIPQEIQPPNREDFMIVKYNPLGDTLWTRKYNVTEVDEAYDVAIDRIGNIIITGSILGDSTNADIHILKYDLDGNTLWARTYSNGMKGVGEFAYGVATDSKCNIIVTGRGTSLGHLPNYITLKYDSSGNIIWMREYDGGYIDCAQDVAVDDSDNVIVTGYSDSNINWDWCTIKYSPDGDIIWVRRHDVSLTDWAYSVTTDNLGNVIVAGETRYLPGSGGATGMLVKYSTSGDTLWSKIFTDTLKYSEVARFVDVATDNDGNIYLAGDYVQWDTSGKLGIDYYIAKCNSFGDTLWTFRYDYDNEDNASGIALDIQGNVVITGTTNHDWYEKNFLTIKIKDIVNLVADDNPLPGKFILYPNYPNPFNPETIIEFTVQGTCLVVLKVYNLLGQELETLVNERKGQGTYGVKWNAAQYASGVYVVRLTAGTFIETNKMLLLR